MLRIFVILFLIQACATAQLPERFLLPAYSEGSDELDVEVVGSFRGIMAAVWKSNRNTSDSLAGDFDVFMNRSLDWGKTWQTPYRISGRTEYYSEQNPTIAESSVGWIAWTGSFGFDSDVMFSFAGDFFSNLEPRATWSVPDGLNTDYQTDSTANGVIQKQDFDIDLSRGDRHMVAVWNSDRVEVYSGGYMQQDETWTRAIFTARGRIGQSFIAEWSDPKIIDPRFEEDTGSFHYVPQVEYGNQVHLCAWYTDHSLDGTIGIDLDVLYARSTDDGLTWSAAMPIKHTSNVDTDMSDVRPSLATNGRGKWMMVWASNDFLSDTIGFDYDILASFSEDDGLTWSSPMPVNSDAAFDTYIDGDDIGGPKALFDRQKWGVVWPRRDDNDPDEDWDLVFSAFDEDSDTWGPIQMINRNASFDTADDRNISLAASGSYMVDNNVRYEYLAVWESSERGDPDGDVDLLFTSFRLDDQLNAISWLEYR